MKILIFLIFLLVRVAGGDVVVASPLRYQSFAVLTVEASVVAICVVDASPVGGDSYEPQRSPQPTINAEVQKIRLRVLRILEAEATGFLVAPIHRGDTVEVTNQYLDQPPPFAVGDKIRARLRLVLPEEKYDPTDPNQQWWFFPPDGEASIGPPRQPFEGIAVID